MSQEELPWGRVFELLCEDEPASLLELMEMHPALLTTPLPAFGSMVHLAARRGHIHTVRALLKAGIEVDVRNEEGFTAIVSAAHEARIEIVRVLLDHGATLETHTTLNNPLFGAIIAGRQRNEYDAMERAPRVAQLLLEAGLDPLVVYDRSDHNRSALEAAVAWGATEIAEMISAHTPESAN